MRIIPLVSSLLVVGLGAVLSAGGVAAQALKLRAAPDHVAVAQHASLVPPGGITVEAWINLTPGTPGTPTIVRKGPLATNDSYNLRIRSGQPQWYVVTPGGSVTVHPAVPVPTGRAVHLAGTWDGTEARLYMDGVLIGTAGGSGAIVDRGGELRIGRGADTTANGGEQFVGLIDAVRIWGEARSQCMIAGGMDRELRRSDGLIASWNFDSDFADATGGGRNGNPVGSLAFDFEFTRFTRSLQLHASGDFVAVPASSQLVPASGITVEAWINLASGTQGIPTIVRKGPLATNDSYNLRIKSGRPQWYVITPGGPVTVHPAMPVPTDRPVHLAGSWDGTQARLYMDGALIGTAGGSGPIVDRGGELRIGRGADTTANGGEQFLGAIDSVRIRSYALSDVEIAQTYGRDFAAMPGMIAAWSFEGDVRDLTGNGHHGSIQGGATFAPEIGAQVGAPCTPVAFGSPSSTCPTPPRIVTGYVIEENRTLRLGSIQGTPLTGGALLLSSGRLNQAFPFAGVGVWVDPSAPFFTSLATATDANGLSFVSFLPPPSAFSMIKISFQYLWIDPSCGSQFLTATDAVEIGL